eukprot:CAMPEP_0168609360 /NCGR_PEP_ID=MMETSP0449_2-20121227/1158_1 /TAXON_ID=1082188 /ORGANISM="Strombidium rassoulzadegani, Strain ras09" /LENGTH=176 /DNA_ID=CAMNT_0008649485 /DNA_START=826 /DNA_END=1353 /DNA_ORIENTATION=+
MADLLRDKVQRTNLFVMVLAWGASSFCFYILGFYMKYIPGDIFINTIITSFCDAVSSIVTGIISQRIGPQKTMTFGFGLSAVGGIALMVLGKSEISIMVFILLTKFGISICFTLCYIITATYFPSIVCSRVFGICNIFSRISTVLSPLMAEVTPPIPMCIYVFVCFVSMVSSMLLK